MAKTYNDPYTLDGRLKYGPFTSEAKVKWTQDTVERMMQGDRQAKGLFEALITTSDLSANLAHLLNATVIPQIDETKLVGDEIASVRRVGDFRTNYLYTLQREVESGVKGKSGTAPNNTLARVPENTPYPEIKFAGEAVEGSEIGKHGASIGVTFEALQNDSVGVVAALPGLFRQLAFNTLEDVVFDALVNTAGTVSLGAQTIVTGQNVAANAALSWESLTAAIAQLQKSIFDNYGETHRGGFNLVVAVGQTKAVEYVLRQTLTEKTNGTVTWSVSNPLSGINIVESGYVTGTNWILLPAKGSLVRPVLDRLTLVGHEAVELRVENLTGNYVGGGAVPFQSGSFETDLARWRARLITGGILWSPKAVLKSTGAA